MMHLQAGPFQIFYEKGFLRQIKQDGIEIIRMIYFALRDRNWGTFEREIENELIETSENGFRITYTCFNINEEKERVFEWKVRIKGDSAGTMVFEIEGKVLKDIWRNRAGFCILHPIEGTATRPVTIIHDAGPDTETQFPRFIAAEDPFLHIRAMRWQAANGGRYQLDFEGDVFQTEDQRNWGDASYKTFCTPLSRPFPVQLYQGATVWQRVTFRLLTPPDAATTLKEKEGQERTPKPFSLGIAASIESETLSEKAVTLLKSLNLSHYRVDLHPASPHWITDFSNHCENAALLKLPLEIALTLEEPSQAILADFAGLCRQNNLKIKHLLLFSSRSLTTSQALIEQIPLLKQQLPNVKIGIGTDYNFTELNRNRFEAGEADFITFSYHPQVHAFDDLSLMENTETLRYQIESAEELYQKPVHVSFISLRQRANPYAANPADVAVPVNRQADPRQKSAFGADWTDSVLTNLAQTNVASMTLFRTIGELGVLNSQGNPYPVFDRLRL
ncbi:MAG: hypothetical protein U0X91_02785 [Spirosomataceae bacterium]